ncbi:unnamed protein product [Caenorhabditis brenneri]
MWDPGRRVMATIDQQNGMQIRREPSLEVSLERGGPMGVVSFFQRFFQVPGIVEVESKDVINQDDDNGRIEDRVLVCEEAYTISFEMTCFS